MYFSSRSDGVSLQNSHCLVMGILNVTPDSFSDGGRVYASDRLSLDKALERTQIITKMEVSGRLNAGEYAFGNLCHLPVHDEWLGLDPNNS